MTDLGDALVGVRVEVVVTREDGKLMLLFGHGVRKGSGYLLVDPADVHLTNVPDREASTAYAPEAR